MGIESHEQGRSFELNNLEVIKSEGLAKYVTFHNPLTSLWNYMRHSGEGMGVDLIMVIGMFTLYIEESFCSHHYSYRQRWWDKCRAVRFKQYMSDSRHIHIVLTNITDNFRKVSTGVIQLLDVTKLLSLIRSLLPESTTSLTTTLDRNRCIGMVTVSDNRQLIDDPNHEAWLEEQIERAIKLNT
jgi:hypothetical protein